MEGVHSEKGFWQCNPKDCSRNLIRPGSPWELDVRPWKMQDWGNQPCSMTWSCAKRSKPTYFTVLLQGLELPLGHDDIHFPTFTLLDLEKQLEMWCSTSVLAVLPTKPAVSFCPLRAGGLGMGQKQIQELWPLYQAPLQRPQTFAWPASALV